MTLNARQFDTLRDLIYRNLGAITDITTTMDTHFAYQIFFPSFWVDAGDQPLTAHRVITADEIRKMRDK